MAGLKMLYFFWASPDGVQPLTILSIGTSSGEKNLTFPSNVIRVFLILGTSSETVASGDEVTVPESTTNETEVVGEELAYSEAVPDAVDEGDPDGVDE